VSARSALVPLLLAAASCGAAEERLTRLAGATMGTTWAVQVVDLPPALDRGRLEADVAAVLRGIEARMSTWDAASELSRFNAADSTDWFAVSADTRAVVAEALRVSRVTGGAFDVTVGPLVELWGFGPGGREGPRRRPEPEAVQAALERVGWRWLETRADPPALRKRRPGLRVDLSAIAKGFAVDAVADRLASAGPTDFLVEVGGELRARGRNLDGTPWRLAVERPRSAEPAPPCLLELADGAVATSGDYRNAFEQDGVRYAHVIDPRTGRPAESRVAAATVVAPTAMEADAFATALLVLPPDEGLRLAEREGLAARLLVRDDAGWVEHRTPRFPRPAVTRSRP